MDLLVTLKELKVRQVSFVGLNGMTFDPATPYGRMMATVLTGIADDAVSAVMRSSTPDPERTAA
jgi:hypothetical protein